jgi:hypothetical protein
MRGLALIVLGAVLPSAATAEAYLCVADHVTGYHYNKQAQAWEVARFTTEGKKYLLSEKGGYWVWNTMGEKDYTPCDKFSENDTIQCRAITQYYFSRKTLRYQASVTVAFTILERGTRYADDSPYIEIGRCSAI